MTISSKCSRIERCVCAWVSCLPVYRLAIGKSQSCQELACWARCGHDGGHLRGYAIGNHQVGPSCITANSQSHFFPSRTKLIDDAKRPNPQYRGLIHGTTSIIRQEGIAGIYRGLFPVVRTLFYSKFTIVDVPQMMRQGANSAVRFTTYSTLKQFVQGSARPGQPLPSAITFGIGGIAGLVTVYTTMPLE